MFIRVIAFLAVLTAVLGFSPSLNAGRSIIQRDLKMLKVGEAAPDFELSTYDGKKVKLSSFKGKKPVVVFFYPADSTPGCTKEACAFEKKAPDFKKKGAEVFGVSSGGAADKEKFIKTNNLNSMGLLIDAGDKVRTSWAVPRYCHAH